MTALLEGLYQNGQQQSNSKEIAHSNYCNMALIYSWCPLFKAIQKGVLRNSKACCKKGSIVPLIIICQKSFAKVVLNIQISSSLKERKTNSKVEMNELILFCVFEVQCDINCGNDTVDCLAKKVPSNQKLDMALGVLLGLL